MPRQSRRLSTAKRGGGSRSIQALASTVSGRVTLLLETKPWMPYIFIGVFVFLIVLWPISHSAKSDVLHRAPDGEDMQTPSLLPSKGIRMQRVGCRNYDSGGQSCSYAGIACVDVTQKATHPLLYFVDDGRPDFTVVSSDNWCEYEMSGDPRLANWPPRRVFAPRHSCVHGYWRTFSSLFDRWFSSPVVRWVGDMAWMRIGSEILPDTAWLLDIALWQETLDGSGTISGGVPKLFETMTKIFVPFSMDEFERKTAADIDRLLLAVVLRLNTTKLYRNQTDVNSPTRPLLVAYPNLRNRIIFYNEEQQNGTLDLICTRKLTIGATLNDLGDAAVCDRLRSDAWNLYDVSASNSTQVGHVRFVRPPRRVVFLRDRFDRVDELTAALRAAATHHRFELEIRTAGSLVTARDQVKTFAGAGVLLMARGAHKLGPLWMPRHSSIIEVFPAGYTDFKVRSVAQACNLWYHEIHGRIAQERREEYLDKCVHDAGIIGPEQCTVMNKYNIEIDVDETMRMVMLAYKKLGYNVAT